MNRQRAMLVVLAAGGLFCGAANVCAEDESEKGYLVKKYLQSVEDSEQMEDEVSAAEKEADIQYEKLMEAFQEAGEYPDYYAGSYINEDGDLVVNVAEFSDEIQNEVRQASQNSDIVVKQVEYSLNELDDAQEMLNEIYERIFCSSEETGSILQNAEYNIIWEDVVGYGIDEEQNRVVIDVQGLTDDKRAVLSELLSNDERFAFEEGGTTNAVIDVKPGKKIYPAPYSSDTYMSAGYRAYWYNSAGTRYNGFVTASHGISVGQNVYAMQGVILGVCKVSVWQGSVDAAFVAITNSSYTPSNQVYYRSSGGKINGVTLAASSWMYSYALNGTIYKSGATTYLTSGTINRTSYTLTYNGKTISDLLRTSALVLPGDSGGVVYCPYNDVYVKAGTVAAGEFMSTSMTEDTFVWSYFSKIDNQISALGIGTY